VARADDTELIDRFEEFYRKNYRNEIGELAQQYPTEEKSLYVDWGDLYRFDPDLADDVRTKPGQLMEYAEEALRLYDLPVDVSLGQAHVRVEHLPETTDIREIRHDHHGRLIAVQGIVRKATDVRPKITDAAFECQRCGTLTRIPQTDGDFQEPHECQGCERQGPFRINFDQSEFVDAQKLRIQESPEGLRGGETPQNIDVNIEDDITGEVTAGDHVQVTGVLKLDQRGNDREKSPMFDVYMDGMTVTIEDEQFEEMAITDADKKEIVELSNEPDLYEQMQGAIAPSIYGYETQKLAMVLQLFSGVTKHLPDESRIRGDLHMLLIGDPGTGKCLAGDTKVTLGDGRREEIRRVVEKHLEDPKPVDDGVYDTVDIPVPSVTESGQVVRRQATKVWKREAPDRMYRIETASGRTLEVTPSHPLFVQSEGRLTPRKAEDLKEGAAIAGIRNEPSEQEEIVPDGGQTVDATAHLADSLDGQLSVEQSTQKGPTGIESDVRWDRIESIETVDPDYEWVYDLEVAGTHTYLSNGIVSHNSKLLQYIRQIAPRSVYTSGKGSSAAGLTAAAVRDDFGDGQQWTLEAGALVLADQGIAAVDELDKMRCVTGETLVRTVDGITPIRELALGADESCAVESHDNGRTIRDVDQSVWTMTADGRLRTREITAIHEYDAPATLRRVTLESGETVTGTADHPFFVLTAGERVERTADELRPGDWVYVPRSIPQPSTDGGVAYASCSDRIADGDVTPAHGAVLGYIAGDGNIYYDRDGGSYGIRFTNAEEELLADFERACREAFDATPVRHPSEQRTDGVETVRVHGREYADGLLDIGLNLETYDGKRVPAGVAQGPERVKAAFLRSLADSEGCVADRNVKICSSSYELLLGAKMLLAEFGVTSQIQTREREQRRDVYLLAITAADSLAAFRRHVGFTLSRKQDALEEVCERTTGNRTIIDVLPECGGLFACARESLCLYQSECGLDAVTYCNFENGDANCSLSKAERVLDRFERRRERARQDAQSLRSDCSWGRLETLTERYHVSQRDLADGTAYSQQQVSRYWGDDPALKTAVRCRLREVVGRAAETDLDHLSDLVRGDVKWRRVTAVDVVEPSVDDGHVPVLRHRLADMLGTDETEAIAQARTVLDTTPGAGSWDGLGEELERHDIPLQRVADRMDVAGSTVSRWFSGAVDGESFETVRDVAMDLVGGKRGRMRSLLTELDERQSPKVYDLTVDGTHNFLANGMVVHNSEDRSAMHEALEQQSYHPDTEILLSDGRRVRIGDFVDERMDANPDAVVDGVDCEICPVDGVGVHTVDVDDQRVEKTDIDRLSRHEAPGEFVRVTFSNGREVTVTPEHPMFVDNGTAVGTVEARDIEEGTFVPAPRKLPNSSEAVELEAEPHVGKEKDVDLPETLTPDLGEILGLLVPEGHSYAGSAHEIGFSNQNQRLLDRMDRLMGEVFGMESTDTTNSAGTVTKRWVSTKLYRWFERNVPDVMHTAREKRIPSAVLGASEEVIRRFLVGAFAGDGGVESEVMSFSTASEGLARDYADALSKIGVASRIHYDKAEDSWKTYVMGDSTERFVEQVVTETDERYNEARAFVERSNETPRHHDVFPPSAAREIRALRRVIGLGLTGKYRPHLYEDYGVQIETVQTELSCLRDRVETVREAVAKADDLGAVRDAIGWSGRQLAERLDGVTKDNVQYAETGGYDRSRRESLTRRARDAVLDALDDADRRIDALDSRCDLRYYRVTDVETVPNEGDNKCGWVYDVTVEPTNTFVSQGVVLHNSISISKAGINATLKSRCSLLGAANPKYGRFDQYEPIAEQIDLEPALVSRFDLIFTVTDEPDEEEDANLAEHILTTNYAGELHTHRTETSTSNYTADEVETVTDEVAPTIEPELLRKYVAYAKRNCFPTMTEAARAEIRDFYVDLRSRGADEDAPVPVTARKLEALVRLAEASARVRLSDSVEVEDAERAVRIARHCLEDIGMDPETGEYDADMIETGTSKSQRDRIKDLLSLIADIEDEYDEGAPVDVVIERAEEGGMEASTAEHEIEQLKQKGEVYEPRTDHLRTT
jgi:replicative DNA helicase Mcm